MNIVVNFYVNQIQTLVTSNPSDVHQCLVQIQELHSRHLHRLIIGFDIEWRPCYPNNDPQYSIFRNPIATLQLCVGLRCLIFQIIHSNHIPSSLINFLANPDFTFVGILVQDHLSRLAVDYNLFMANAVDIAIVAAENFCEPHLRLCGLKGLAREMIDLEFQKPRSVIRSEWDNVTLSFEQIHFASVDAFLCFEIGKSLIVD